MATAKRQIRNHFDRVRVSIEFNPDEKRTKSQFKDECDINKIMDKFHKTGLISHTAKYAPQYGDALSIDELHEAKFKIAEANTMFEELPSPWRKKFENIENFLEFVGDPKNEEEMREMGLLPKNDAETASTDDKPKPTETPKPSAKDEEKETKGDTDEK